MESLIRYKQQDINLIKSKTLLTSFNSINGDYIDIHIYDVNNNLLLSSYTSPDYLVETNSAEGGISTVKVLPESTLKSANITSGTYRLAYNFFRNKLITSTDFPFFIKEISSDRTEIRLGSTTATQEDIEDAVNSFISEFTFTTYYKYLTLNFRQDSYPVSVNIALDTTTDPYTILLKLYEPLPAEYGVKDQLYIVEEISDPVLVEVTLEEINVPQQTNILRGPNFSVEAAPVISSETGYQTWSSILSNNSQTSYQQLVNNLELAKSAKVNIDYSSFSNFIHFSSAKERIQNFYYKIQLIEQYTTELNNLKNVSSGSVTAQLNITNSQGIIDNLIKGFDGFENYMYFNSGSELTYPKTNSTKPYVLFSYSSSQALTWLGSDLYSSGYYGGIILSASVYDDNNEDNLIYSIPEYIRSNTDNQAYLLFINMLSQHFDNQWIFAKGITDIYNNNSNVNKGISKDLVYYALKSLGFKLYSGNNNTNIFEYFVGSTPSGSLLPTTGSDQTLIYVNDESIPREDITKEIWSRIYHNIPLLLKAKGTERSVRALINSYGIPSTILRITEYGGPEVENSSSYNELDKFNYSLYLSGSGYLTHPWLPTYQSYLKTGLAKYPETLQIRFKIPNTGSLTNQTLISKTDISTGTGFSVTLENLNTTGSTINYNIYQSTSGSKEISINIGDIGNLSNKWFNLTLYNTSIATGPNYNTSYNIDIRNKEFGIVNHIFTGSVNYINVSSSQDIYKSWNNSGSLYIGYNYFTSQSSNLNVQEYRYWSVNTLSTNTLNDHTLSPENYNGNNPTSSFYDLQFRAPLGTDLYIQNLNTTSSIISIQPDTLVQGYTTQPVKIALTSSNLSLSSYVPNYEYIYINWPSVGMNRTVSNKIRIESGKIDNNILDISVRAEESAYDLYPADSNRLSISFSPTMEIDEDISNQLGGFKIDDYIGDPSYEYQGKYDELTKLKDLYYKKYFKSFNIWDYIRLIQYYDTSIFSTLKQLVPERATLYTGVEVKSDILNRGKVKLSNKPTVSDLVITSSYNMLPVYIGSLEDLPVANVNSQIQPSGVVSGYEGEVDTPFIGSTDDYEGPYDRYKLSNFYLKKSQGTQNLTIVDPAAFFKSSIVPFITRIIGRFASRSSVSVTARILPNVKVPSFQLKKAASQITYETASLQDDYNYFTWYQLNRYEGVKHTSTGYNEPSSEIIGLIPIESYTRNTVIYQGLKTLPDIPGLYEITNCIVDPEPTFISPVAARNVPPRRVTFNDLEFVLEPDDIPTFLTRSTSTSVSKYIGNRSQGTPFSLVVIGHTLVKYIDTVDRRFGGPFYRNNNISSFTRTVWPFSFTSGSYSLRLPFRLGTKQLPRTTWTFANSASVTFGTNPGSVKTVLTSSFGLFTSSSFKQDRVNSQFQPGGIRTGDIMAFFSDYLPPATSSLQTAYITTYTTRSVQLSDIFFETSSGFLTGSSYAVIEIPTVPNSSEINLNTIDQTNLSSWYFSNTPLISGFISGSIYTKYSLYNEALPYSPVYSSAVTNLNFSSVTPPNPKIVFIVTKSYVETINTGSSGFALGWYRFIPVKDRSKVIIPPQYRTLTTITGVDTGSVPGRTFITISPGIDISDPSLDDISFFRYRIFRPVRNNTSILAEFNTVVSTTTAQTNTVVNIGTSAIPQGGVLFPTSNTPSATIQSNLSPAVANIGRILPVNLHPDIYNLYMSNGSVIPPVSALPSPNISNTGLSAGAALGVNPSPNTPSSPTNTNIIR